MAKNHSIRHANDLNGMIHQFSALSFPSGQLRVRYEILDALETASPNSLMKSPRRSTRVSINALSTGACNRSMLKNQPSNQSGRQKDDIYCAPQ